MTRRRLLLLTALTVPLLWGGLWLLDALTWQPGISERNAARVRPGMTLAEVGKVFGKQPTKGMPDGKGYGWDNEQGCAAVSFDGRGHVRECRWDYYGPPPSFLDRIKAWFGW